MTLNLGYLKQFWKSPIFWAINLPQTPEMMFSLKFFLLFTWPRPLGEGHIDQKMYKWYQKTPITSTGHSSANIGPIFIKFIPACSSELDVSKWAIDELCRLRIHLEIIHEMITLIIGKPLHRIASTETPVLLDTVYCTHAFTDLTLIIGVSVIRKQPYKQSVIEIRYMTAKKRYLTCKKIYVFFHFTRYGLKD